jgi:hypothetical protein
MPDGFNVNGLDAYVSDLLELAEEALPRESKKFLKKNAGQLARATKNKAKDLGIMDETGNYYSSFKSGKVYKYNGNMACRAINSSPHAHLLEYGHLQVDKEGKSVGKGFVPGFHVFEKTQKEFQSKYYDNCEEFVEEMIREKGL